MCQPSIHPQYLKPSARTYIDANKVAVVCSARSGSTKALGTTNLLLKAASEALSSKRLARLASSGTTTPINGGLGLFGHSKDPSQSSPPWTPFGSISEHAFTPASPSFNATVDLIRQEHFTAARESIQDADILKELEEEIENDCNWLRSFLLASQVRLCFYP